MTGKLTALSNLWSDDNEEALRLIPGGFFVGCKCDCINYLYNRVVFIGILYLNLFTKLGRGCYIIDIK
jgi:hypothetical protein